MSDNKDNVVEAKVQGKNPVEIAINKMKEAKAKELQAKVDAQVKVAMDARVVADAEEAKLHDLIETTEADKARLAAFGKSLA